VDVPGVKNQVAPRGRAAAQGELRALFGVCQDGTPLGARDAALLALAYGCGLRRAEVVALEAGDYNTETGELLVRRGKGNKARTVYVTGGAREAVAAWMLLRGESEGPLLWPVLKGGHLVARRLSAQTVRMCCTGAWGRLESRRCRRTTCGAASSRTCLKRGPTSRRCRSWPGTQVSRPRRATTGAASTPRRRPPGCSMCHLRAAGRSCSGYFGADSEALQRGVAEVKAHAPIYKDKEDEGSGRFSEDEMGRMGTKILPWFTPSRLEGSLLHRRGGGCNLIEHGLRHDGFIRPAA
jgi:hypothetical protein